MGIAFGIAFIALGLYFMTPAGAAVGARVNRRHEHDTFQGPNTKPTSVRGMQVAGSLFVVAGIFVLVRGAS